MKVTGNQGMKNMRKNSTVSRTRATMTLFSTIWMRWEEKPLRDNSVHIRWPNMWSCCSRFMRRKYWYRCHLLRYTFINTGFCGGWDRRGRIMKCCTVKWCVGIKPTLHALRGDHVGAPLSQQIILRPPPLPQAINNDPSLMGYVNRQRQKFGFSFWT